jgi:hypothetical protein
VAAPGWYADNRAPNQERWWDGAQWTEYTRLVAANETSGWSIAALVIGIAVFVACCAYALTMEDMALDAEDHDDLLTIVVGGVIGAAVLTGIVAALAAQGTAEARRKRMGGIGLAKAGRIVGVLGLACVLLFSAQQYPHMKAIVGERSDDFPPAVRANFLTGCFSSGGDESRCRCALEEVEARFDIDEYIEEEDQFLTTGEFPPRVLDAFGAC